MQIRQHFTMKVRCPRGTIAIGGYSPVPEELDAVHARDRDGAPLLPSTALRGGLRESFEALLRGAGFRACRGGDGVDPRDQPSTGEAKSPEPCTLEQGGPCKACQLFGTQRASSGPNAIPFGALVLGDALAHPETAHPWSITHGVSIERQRRSAADGRLFNRETPAPGVDLVFVAEGRVLDPTMADELEAAVALTKHIGSNVSRGLGRVDIELDWRAARLSDEVTMDDLGRQVVVTLRQPACIGALFSDENLLRTRTEIPGSTIRGAVGWAIAERLRAAGKTPSEDAEFEALVAEEDGAIFDFLYACDDPVDGVAGPWPLTRRRCKHEMPESPHPRSDVLFERIAMQLVETGEEAQRVASDATNRRRCSVCDAPMKRDGGLRGRRRGVKTRIITRSARDGRRRSVRGGLLFSNQVIEAGTQFVGSIRRLPEKTGARLSEGLAAPLSFGRGRSHGWGRAEVRVEPLPTLPPVAARGDAFQAALAGYLAQVNLSRQLKLDHVVALTVLSPLLPEPGDAGETDDADDDTIRAALGGDARLITKARRFGVESAWDQRHGVQDRRRSVVGGSVYVFELTRPWREQKDQLAALERTGIGAGRCRGHGRVLFFDTAFTRLEAEEMTKKRDGEQTQRLVDAAERVMSRAFGKGDKPLDRGKLSKSQMSQLIGVCQEATCHEEIVNYLRYQAGRNDPAWTLPMSEEVYSELEGIFEKEKVGRDDHDARLDRWRRYATFLTRAFTYHDAVQRDSERRRQR